MIPQKKDLIQGQHIISTSSHETETLAIMLSQVEVGEVLTYQEMTNLIKRDVQNEARHTLRAARRRVMRDHGKVFDTVENVGVMCLDPKGTISKQDRRRASIRRVVRRGQEELNTIKDDSTLGTDDRLLYGCMRAVYGSMTLLTSTKSLERVKERLSLEPRMPTREALIESYRTNKVE